MARITHSQAHEQTSKAQLAGSGNIKLTMQYQGPQLKWRFFMQALAAFEQNNQPKKNDQTQEQGKISEFKKLFSLSFAGITDPLEVEKWLTEIQKAFSIMSCT